MTFKESYAGNFLELIKSSTRNPQHHTRCFSLKIRKKTLLPLLFNTVLDALDGAIRQEKEIDPDRKEKSKAISICR